MSSALQQAHPSTLVEPSPGLTSDKRKLSGPHQTLDRPLRATGRPAIDSVPAAVMDYVLAALADNTRRAYASDLRHFLGWGGTLPASDGMIAQYMVKHADRDVDAATGCHRSRPHRSGLSLSDHVPARATGDAWHSSQAWATPAASGTRNKGSGRRNGVGPG